MPMLWQENSAAGGSWPVSKKKRGLAVDITISFLISHFSFLTFHFVQIVHIAQPALPTRRVP